MTFDPKEARALVERLEGYTEGPWFRHDFRQAHDDPKTSSDISVSCTHPDHLTVAIMHGADQGHDRPEGIEAALHNAALIAAAPDLHRHLTAALAEIERLRGAALLSRAEKAEAERDTAWNDAIEAAADEVTNWHSCDGECVRALRKGEPTMGDTITIVCASCGMKVDTPRCETDPPQAVEMHGTVCPKCDKGGFDMPEFYDAHGLPVSGDPETFSTGTPK